MDPLPQYPDYAFIPYLSSPTSPLPPSPSSATASATDLPPITLHNTSTWTYCGPLLTALPPSFHTWSASTISGPILPRLIPFLSFLHTFLAAAGAQHYWLTVRATKPTSEYDTVRWHTDDLFFDHDGRNDRLSPQLQKDGRGKDKDKRRTKNNGYWKLATTLLGPATLFLKDGVQARRTQSAAKAAECEARGEHTCTSFRCLNCLDAVEAVRQTLATSFAHHQVETPEYGEVAFFRLGDEEGAVHSEPPCHSDRIFVNVVPGSADELSSLMARWGMSFPRSWCFGVPVEFDQVDPLLSASSSSSLPRTAVWAGQATSLEKVVDKEDIDDTRSISTTSTMSLNLREEYSDWLRQKGFRFSQVFGQSGGTHARSRNHGDRGDSGVEIDRIGGGVGMKAGFNV